MIAEIAELKRQGIPKPKCFCLSCDRSLIARIGKKRRHHFAHAAAPADERCWATSREGELHIEAKHLIDRVLKQACASGDVVYARAPCPTCGVLRETREVVRVSPHHEVRIEDWGDPRKTIVPDVQVRDSQKNPVLFIEVHVTNESAGRKIQTVRESGVPFIEVPGKWIVESPLRVPDFDGERELNIYQHELCDHCVQRAEQRNRDEARRLAHEAAQQERRRRRETFRTRAEDAVRTRLASETKSALAAWCHVRFFVESRTVHAERLDLEMTWSRFGARLRLFVNRSREVVGDWAGSVAFLEKNGIAMAKDAAKKHVKARESKMAIAVDIETFGGFRSSGFVEYPCAHERVYDLNSRTWKTMYLWLELAQVVDEFEIESALRARGLRKMRNPRGVPLADARAIDDHIRHRSSVSLARPRPEDDVRWDGEVETEIDRLDRFRGQTRLFDGDVGPEAPGPVQRPRRPS